MAKMIMNHWMIDKLIKSNILTDSISFYRDNLS
jgi:hypothetical protein